MDHMDIVHALETLRPGAIWTVRDATIEWLDKVQTQPTDEEIATAIAAYVPPPTLEQQIATLQAQIATLLAAQGK